MRSSAAALTASVLMLSIAGDAFAAGAPDANAQRSGGQHSSTSSDDGMSGRWSAGPVERWSGYSRAGGSKRVRAVQRRLRALGHRPGPIDGLFGPRTERAVERFQREQGLGVDGVVGPRTLTRLQHQSARPSGRRTTGRQPASGERPRSSPPGPATGGDPGAARTPAAAPSPRAEVGVSSALLALLAIVAVLVTLLAVIATFARRGPRSAVVPHSHLSHPGSRDGRDWPAGPVWVVLPTYNEADNVERMLAALLSTFDDHRLPGHVLVVDDGSPDGTADLAEAVGGRDERVKVLRRSSKDGIGPAYRAGFRRALNEGAALVMEMDCDFSHDPAGVPGLVAAAREADVVLGSRYVAGGGVERWNIVRRAISRGGCEYARWLLGVDVRDLTGGFKCFRREVLERIPLDDVSAAGYGFQVEMTYRAILLGFRVVEVPITFSERDLGNSKMSRGIVLEAALLVPRLRRGLGLATHPTPVPAGVDVPDLMGALARAEQQVVPKQRSPRPEAVVRPDGDGRLPLGQLLRDSGVISEDERDAALEEQVLTGGRLGEILLKRGAVDAPNLLNALARTLGLQPLRPDDEPVALLPRREARAWRAVALKNGNAGPVPVAVDDLSDPVLDAVAERLQRPIEPRLSDEATLDALMARIYARDDIAELTRSLREKVPHLSAFRTNLSRAQWVTVAVISLVTVAGLIVAPWPTLVTWTGIATAFYVFSTGFRLYMASRGWGSGSTISPSDAEVAALDQRELPTYSVLVPLYGEKPSTVRALFEALSSIEYPKHKLDGLLLVEADDNRTRDAIEAVGRPPWLKVLALPPGKPRTKPRAMLYGLRYAKGSLLTVYDAEDRPDPLQLKKAVWGFRQAASSLACLQAKLSYYNPRQNLLTRWFTLEYDAWFNIFLPGLHRIGAPIPLGGTSNHFRTALLRECDAWDPYNVTEDADLGVRLARMGMATAMLDSTTYEEANSKVLNWLRQRSRWIKGYMQTFVVHTRHPLALVRALGVKGFVAFVLTIGGSVLTALISPIFWVLLVLWFIAQPGWIGDLFPGPIYYPSLISLVIGNFLLVLLSLVAAVGRGHDDLAPHSLLIPVYWLMMSAAAYVALVELVFRPHHWHKTEHGLHFEGGEAQAPERDGGVGAWGADGGAGGPAVEPGSGIKVVFPPSMRGGTKQRVALAEEER